MSAAVERDLWRQMVHRAWPLSWRVGRRDLEVCYLKLVTEGECYFAGSTYKVVDGKVWEVRYDFEGWRRWREEQVAAVDWTVEVPKGDLASFNMRQGFSREEWAGWFEAQQHGVSWPEYLLGLQVQRNAVPGVKPSSSMVSTSSADLCLEYDAEIQGAIERHASEQNGALVWEGKRRLVCDEQ